MYKQDLTLNNQQGFICHKIRPTEPSEFKLVLDLERVGRRPATYAQYKLHE